MILRRLQLENFRVFDRATILFAPQVNVVTGGNGEGKTTLLEAVAFLSTGRSFRTKDNSETIRDGCEFASVEAEISFCPMSDSGEIIDHFRIYIAPYDRHLLVNGEKQGAQNYYGRFGCVILTERDMLIVRGTPEERRRFVDRAMCSSDKLYFTDYLKYQRTLKQRNSLLKSASDSRMPLSRLKTEISAWDGLLVETGTGLMEKREVFLKNLSAIAGESYFSLFNSVDRLLIKYLPSVKKKLAA